MERETPYADHNPSPADYDPEQHIGEDEVIREDVDRGVLARADFVPVSGSAVVAPDVSVSPRPVTGTAVAEPLTALSPRELEDTGLSPRELEDTGGAASPMDSGVDEATLERIRQNEAAGAKPVEAPPESIQEDAPVTAITDATGRTTSDLPLQPGMEVFSLDDHKVGSVKEVRISDFLVNRPLARDVFVPFECVRTADGGRVSLKIASGEIDDQGWVNP